MSWGGAEREKVEVEKSVQGPEPHRAERWLLFLNGPLSLSDSSLVLLLSFLFTFPWWMTISVSAVSSGLTASMSERTAETC